MGEKRAVALLNAGSAQPSLVVAPQSQREAAAPIVLVDVEMQVRGAARMFGLLVKTGSEEPANEFSATRVVGIIARRETHHHFRRSLESREQLQGAKITAYRTEQISDNLAIGLRHCSPLRFVVEIRSGEQFRKQF